MKNIITPLIAVAACGISWCSAQNFVLNGDFESTTSGSNKQLGYNTNATNWTTGGYNFLFAPGIADTTGATGESGAVKLWGSNNGGTTVLPSTSPSGGNYVAADGAYKVGAISQTLSGLTVGASYDLSFYWAAAQQSGFNGATTDQWKVSLGGQTKSTAVYNLPNHGFSGWMTQMMTFTADSAAPVLSFLSVGTPSGLPPFALLDGVTLTATPVPEPSSFLLAALFGSGVAFRRRRR